MAQRGWLDRLKEIGIALPRERRCIHLCSNFSLGVNLFLNSTKNWQQRWKNILIMMFPSKKYITLKKLINPVAQRLHFAEGASSDQKWHLKENKGEGIPISAFERMMCLYTILLPIILK